jgi:hypothetical protein
MRDRWQYYGSSKTPVQQTLALAGLQALAANCTHMLRPNYADRVAGNRHYPYVLNTGWSDVATMVRTEAKYDVIGNALATVAANNLGANGRVEAASINRESSVLNDWGAGFLVTKTGDYGSAPYGLGLSTRAVYNAGGGGDLISGGANFSAPGNIVTCSIWAKGSGQFNFVITADDGIHTSDVLTLTTSWKRFSYCAALVGATYTLHTLVHVDNIDMECCYPLFEFGLPSTDISFGGTRTADALRIATGIPAGIKTTGGLVVMLRLPYASTVPASDQYHLGLNGSNSLDDGVFLWTDASADTLIAELRSGGVSQGTVDLGAYSADTQYAIALGWSSAGLVGAINGVEKTATGAVTVPASIDRLEIGRGISTDTAHGGETPLVMLFNALPTLAERAGLSGATLKAGAFSGL